ncbi:MAG TPA: ParB/RepB/Spo0J family partition protein [Mollicutes bacterium]|nr:ParB/RepB/Spo0J family partition protein [Mollicutes bacterium]
MNEKIEKEIVNLFIDDILPNRFQPRLTFDEKALNELADSIRQHGIIQPLVVRKLNDKYEIIAGERRYKAAQLAGLQKVPAIVMNLNDNESAEVAVVENIQRKDLSALEEAESYKKLLDKGYLTQEQLANRMGKNQSTISNKLRLLGLSPEVKEALLNGKISERHARSLLNLKNAEDQKQVLEKIISSKLTVRQTDDLIKTIQNPAMQSQTSPNIELEKEKPDVIENIIPSVETLDFNETLNNSLDQVPSAPIPYIDMPRIKEEPIISNIQEAPLLQPAGENEGIGTVDVDQIKEKAEDINPVKENADVNKLLGITPADDNISTPNIEHEKPEAGPRFIMFPEEAEAEKNKINESNDIKNDFHQGNQSKTFTDSLVAEYRQTNGIVNDKKELDPNDLNSGVKAIRSAVDELKTAGFKVNVEDFDFENIYQMIIKIEKN